MVQPLIYLKRIGTYWRPLVIILTPLVLLPIPLALKEVLEPPAPEFDSTNMANCAYVVAIMGVYWVSEAFPISVTALLPLFAFPVLQILSAKVVAKFYVNDLTFLFIGGLMFGVAVEEMNLHRRIAVRILLLVGSQPRWLLAGIIVSTAFLSMWISNTATSAMMVPVVLALAAELIRVQRQDRRIAAKGNDVVPMTEIPPSSSDPKEAVEEDKEVIISEKTLSKEEQKFCKCLLLAVCYSASLGGTATLTGTLPNVVMTALLDKQYGTKHPINYATWMGYNFPGMLINITAAWCWLQLLFFGPRSFFTCRRGSSNPRFTFILKRELDRIGPVSFGEVSVMVLFLILLLLWLTRGFIWNDLFGKNVSDATSAMFISLILFCWPREKPDFRAWFSSDPERLPVARKPILNWEIVEKRLPWGVVLLLGGGMAVGGGVSATGLADLIGNQLATMHLSREGLLLVSLVIMTYTTEFTSNTATSSLVLPIIMKLAEKRCLNPLYLTLPTTESASFAFMLPVATPPNAIVFGAGILKVTDMLLAGFFMNIFCMCEVMLSINTWGFAMFHLDKFPDWIAGANFTQCQNETYVNAVNSF